MSQYFELPDYRFNLATLKLGSVSLSYVNEGLENKPAIVMLHGNPTWSFYYRALINQFKDRFHVIVPDHVGCGLSDKPADYPYTLKRRVDDIETLIEHLNLKDIILVGHDWGVAIGAGYAVRNPSNIKKLVIFNGAAFCSDFIPFRIKLLRSSLAGSILIRKLNLFLNLALPPVGMATSKKSLFSDEILRGYRYPYRSYQDRVAIDQFVQDIPMSEIDRSYLTLKDIESKLESLRTVKSLILWGGDDWCFNRYFYERWLTIFSNLEAHYIQGAGHFVVEDATDYLIEKMEQFLK
ncbi:MAG: alpha/beta fold hydrolase [Nitrospinota bacterium]